MAVASLAPSAAIWVATTFGTASTGTAISTLTGAAASKAALAWIGGGAIAAGGGGTAAGSAILALAGPIGWGIAGATLLTSIAIFAKKRIDNREERQKALLGVIENTAQVDALAEQLHLLLNKTSSIREELTSFYNESIGSYRADFVNLSLDQQKQLGTLVNNTLSCSKLLAEHITAETTE